MPRQLRRTDLIEQEVTESIIGGFYYVYNQLGYGFFEKIYAEALSRKLRKLGHLVQREVRVPIYCDCEQVGLQKLDILVDSKVIVEIKSSFQLCDADHRQLRSYVTASEIQVGLRLHFGPKPEFHRMVSTRSPRGGNSP
jgi:GxxExxY protein